MTAEIGRVLGGRYRLVAPIGMGASAQVYLADDVRLRRRVALKMLHDALADDAEFLRRFRAEARAAAALSHPNVMAVYDWGDDDVAFIVTEYLDGGSLRGLLDQGESLSPAQALTVGLEASRGLDYAHRRGFVHRDVKPANLLFGEEQRLRIADFGLARALAEAAWTEPQGAMLGTARYASPELARGEKLDGKADVYALALVLVEAVTGEVPFAADTTIGTLMARVDRQLEVPDALGPLQAVLARAGHPDPEQRIDARTLAAGLLRAAKALPRPADLPLAGALRPAGGVKVDDDPTVHAPMVGLVSEPDPDLDLTADDLDLDPPAWVNQAEPAIGEVERAGDEDGERDGNADEPSVSEAGHDQAEDDEPDSADELGHDQAEGDEPDSADELGHDQAEGDEPDSADALDPDPEPEPERELDSALGLRDPSDPAPGGGGTGPGSNGPASEPVRRVADSARTASVASSDRTLVGAGVARSGGGLPATGTTQVDGGATRGTDVVDLTDRNDNCDDRELLDLRDPDSDHADGDHPHGDEIGRRRRRRWPWVVVVTVALIGGGAVAATAVADRGPAAPARVVVLPVPRLTDRTQSDAEAIVAAAGWRTSVVTERRDGSTRGQVLATDPGPGSRLGPAGSVELTVSAGQTEVDVPADLAGRSLPDATAALAFSGLLTATGEERFDEAIGAGGVIGTAGGTSPRLERGSAVTLVVSKGPEPRIVPTVAGETQAAATQALDALGLEVAVDLQFDDTIGEGRVVSQEPPPGEQVPRDATVTIEVSMGPNLVTVPGVAGDAQAEATDALEALGLDVAVDPQFSDTVDEGRVVSQDPGRGERVSPGATVTIVVSRGPNLVTVPGVAGDAQAEATDALEALGLDVAVDPQFNDTVDEGLVVSQNPRRGEGVPPGATVTIEVSKGPNLVPVPDVSSATTPAGAAAILRSKGLFAGSVSGSAEGSPTGTLPSSGTAVEPGSTIDIVLG